MNQSEEERIAKIRESWNKIYNTAASFISRHTIPIFRNKDGELILHGTGLLIEHENHYFLVSAAHVLEINISDEIILAVNDIKGMSLSKIAKFTPHIDELKDRKNDKIDIAVVRFFQSELLEKLKESNVFLPTQSIIKEHDDTEGLPNYLVLGYPEFGIEFNTTRNGLEIDSDIMVMPTKISPFKDFGKYGCNPDDNIFVEYFKNMTIANGTKSLNKIKPHCISGCGLWYINIQLIQNESKIRYGLVGVIIECQTRYHRVLIATKMKHVMNLINAHIKMF